MSGFELIDIARAIMGPECRVRDWASEAEENYHVAKAVHQAERVLELWNTRAPDPAVAVLEAEVARLRGQIKYLTKPDLFWDEDGEDFAGGDYIHIWEGGVFQVSVGKSLGFRYAAYIPTEIEPETGTFDAGYVKYFPTEAEAIAAQDAAVKALNPAPSEKEAG